MKIKTVLSLVSGLLLTAPAAFANEAAADNVNKLLRGELAAVDTYQQALKKLGDEPGAKALRTTLMEHKDTVAKLTKEVKKLNAEPSTDAGAWGTWSQTIVGSAKILGDEAALKALKEGEEHGLKEYKEALGNSDTPERVKEMIRNTFLKRQQKHIARIDEMMKKN